MLDENALLVAFERFAAFNAGAAVPTVDPSYIEQDWGWLIRIAPNVSEAKHSRLRADAMPNSKAVSRDPEQYFPTAMRDNILRSLFCRGVLHRYLQDAASRKRVFLAAATMPCTKDDVGEALALLALHQGPPEAAQQMRKHMQEQAYDPDHPEIDQKFIRWMQDNC